MQRKTLEHQADRIEAVLTKHKAPGQVTGGLVSPRWIKFDVLPDQGARVSKIKGLAEELALALNSDSCRVSRRGNVLAVEIPRLDPQLVRLLPLHKRLAGQIPFGSPSTGPSTGSGGASGQAAPGWPFGTAILGIGEDGEVLLMRLPSPDVGHVLVSGAAGSGKTALARSLIVSLALSYRRSQLGFVLVDLKGKAFDKLRGLPHLLRPVLREPDEATQALADLVEVMIQRDQTHQSEPKVVVVIDELADLLLRAGRDPSTSSGQAPSTGAQGRLVQALTRLAQRGRETGIHLVACTQKPTYIKAKLLDSGSSGLADVFPMRLVGRETSPEEARCAAGVGDSGAEQLTGRGDFVVVMDRRRIRFQAAHVSEDELAQVVEKARDQAKTDREQSIAEVLVAYGLTAAVNATYLDGSVEYKVEGGERSSSLAQSLFKCLEAESLVLSSAPQGGFKIRVSPAKR